MFKFFHGGDTSKPSPNIDDPSNLIRYISGQDKSAHYVIQHGNVFPNRNEVGAFIWILMIDDTPIYAIVPGGPFAFEIHDTLVAFLIDQQPPAPASETPASSPPYEPQTEGKTPPDPQTLPVFGHGAERVSIPGLINGQVRLFTGEAVPVIFPDLRGMFSWRTDALVKATKDAAQASDDSAQTLQELLNRIYFETRNLGVTSADRALNYAVTNALLLQGVVQNFSRDPRLSDYTLDSFEVERSPVCRPDADCWDVKFVFYNPKNILQSRRISRFTVDVSDVVPTMIGERKDWFTR